MNKKIFERPPQKINPTVRLSSLECEWKYLVDMNNGSAPGRRSRDYYFKTARNSKTQLS